MMNIEPITFADIWTCDGRLKRETNRNFFEIPRLDLIAQPNTIGQAPSVLSTLGSLRNVRMKQSVKKPVVRGTRSVTNTESNMDSTAGKASNFQSTRFYLAFGSLCIAGLLTSMDSVIIAAALPKISEDLAATSEKSFWTGTGFLLSQAITPPLYGTLSESFGRKPCMLVALGLFTIATLFCATAQSIEWLIAARTIQGIGAGGLNTLCSIVVTDMVGIRKRGKYSGIFALSNACGLLSGVFLGSQIAAHGSWRILFYMNLPLCIMSIIGIQFFLNLQKVKTSPSQTLKTLDWTGIITLMGSTTSLLVGLTTGGVIRPWQAPETLLALTFGTLGLIIFVVVEKYYATNPIMPLRIFADRTALFGYLAIFIHGYIVLTVSYYLLLYFLGGKGHSLTRSAMDLLPGTGTLAPFAAIAGFLMSWTKRFQRLMMVAWFTAILGLALMTQLNTETGPLLQYSCQVIVALGLGFIFPGRTLSIQAVQTDEDIPAATTFVVFFLTLGQAFGVGISGTTFQIRWDALVRREILQNGRIPDKYLISGRDAERSVFKLQYFPQNFQEIYQKIFVSSLETIWVTLAALALVALLSTAMLRDVSLDRDSKSAQGYQHKVSEEFSDA